MSASGPSYRLIIGSKNFSSWSLRPWFLMKEAGLPFEEIEIRLRQPGTRAEILKHSPTGKVPALFDGDLSIWDSLAIAEFLAERHPDKKLWPESIEARATARAVSAEMHSGFAELRNSLPMDFLGRKPMASIPEGAANDIRRVVTIWNMARKKFGAGGPFLFGRLSVADAMFAPVASRFTTYALDLKNFGDDGSAEAYRAMLMARQSMREWAEGSVAEA